MKKYFTFYRVMPVVIIALVLAHVAVLPFSPPGFFLDESAGAAHIVAMIHHGTNAHGESWPLFSASLGGGYTTPIYLYPLIGWATLFGTNELSLRGFSLASMLLAITLLSCAMMIYRGRKAGLITAAVGLSLPWAWIQGSVAWDPALVPLFVAVPVVCIAYLLRPPKSPVAKHISLILLPLSLVLLAYLYPPARITAPLLFIAFYTILAIRRVITPRVIVSTCLIAAAVATPLLAFMLQPDSMERSQQLSIFHDASLFNSLGMLFYNLFLLLNPLFLFVFGDPNLRHATGVQGMLGVAALPAIIAVAYYTVSTIRSRESWRILLARPTVQLMLFAAFGVLAGSLGSALTNEGQPHSLRATAAWPFYVIIIVVGWQKILATRNRVVTYGSILIALLATVWYIVDVAFWYPIRSANAFDVTIRQQINSGQLAPGYPELSQQYYRDR